MLFDLRARGRRRTVQVVYVGLALLFLIGFVGFGVGVGGSGGGLVEGLFGKGEGGGGGYGKQVAAAQARVSKHPGEAAAWAALVEARFHEAGGSEFYDEEKQQFTGKGKELLAKIVGDWNRYVAFKPTPNLTIAYDMLRIFGEEGLNQPAQLEALMQLVIPSKPNDVSLYYYLAKAAYQNKDLATGDLAAQRAVSLTPAKERARVKAYLAELKKNPNASASNQVYTGTTNGKVYSVKVNPEGKGTIVKTSPAPSTTTTKK